MAKRRANPNLGRQFTRQKSGQVHGIEVDESGQPTGSRASQRFEGTTRQTAVKHFNSLEGLRAAYSVTKLQKKG